MVSKIEWVVAWILLTSLIISGCGSRQIPAQTNPPATPNSPTITPAIASTVSFTPTSAPTAGSTLHSIPTNPPTPTFPQFTQSSPTDSYLNLNEYEFLDYYASLSASQRQDYLANIVGKTVDWSCGVFSVDANGVIALDCMGVTHPMILLTNLKNVPAEISQYLKKDDPIRFTGSIESALENYGILAIYITNVQIKK